MEANRIKVNKLEKKSYGFVIFYLVLIGMILEGSYFFLQYVWHSIALFESAQPDYVVSQFVEDVKFGKGLEYFSFPEIPESEFENSNLVMNEYLNLLQTSDLDYRYVKEDYISGERIYNLYANEAPVGKVVLALTSQETRLVIMNLNFYELDRVEPILNMSSYEYDICVTDKDRVYVNDWELSPKYIVGKPKEISDYQYLYEYADMPKLVTYHVDHLYEIPTIRVENQAGKSLATTEKNNTISLVENVSTEEVPQDVLEEIDCMEAAKTWSLFTTRDLQGNAHGLATVQQYFIPDSYYSQKLYEYAHGIDINFVSAHNTPVFTEESISEYTRFSPDCFSCRIQFHKSMRIASGRLQEEDMNNIFYFVKIADGTWRIADIQ